MGHSVHNVDISEPLDPHNAIHVVCGCEASWTYCKILWQQLWWTFVQLACLLRTPLQHETSVALCCVTKLHILEWPFIVMLHLYLCSVYECQYQITVQGYEVFEVYMYMKAG